MGGAVRDLLLGRPLRDIDLALEGDASGFAQSLALRAGARARVHERFGTATLEMPDGVRMDVASTRRETYAHPGALPEVILGATLGEDLARRDFTVHALALDLSRRPPAMIDPFGGTRDIALRRVRFLHPRSPVDDPTRAFRAARYAARLGFSIPAGTRRQVSTAIARRAFPAVSGERLRKELVLLFGDANRPKAMRLLLELGLDRAIAASVAGAATGAVERVRAAEGLGREVSWLCYLLAWMGPAPGRVLRALADRLALSGREKLAVERWTATRRRLGPGFARLAPSRRRLRIEGLSEDEILAAAALRAGADRRALARLAGTEPPTLAISGSDLIAHGAARGPGIGGALAATRAAREDGRIASGRDAELRYALARARASERAR